MKKWLFPIVMIGLTLPSCVSKKKFAEMEANFNSADLALTNCNNDLRENRELLNNCEVEKEKLSIEIASNEKELQLRKEQIDDLKSQIEDLRKVRDVQVSQVEDLTNLSQSANDNIKETLTQLESKDEYIKILQAARTKADSVNLALAVNLKSVLKNGIEDNDVEVKVDKTVVFINLSDKMLYTSGSSTLTPRAKEVLAKIADIIKSRPGMEVMVEGYTDNVPMRSSCVIDNWDLSVKRATSVVRVLQTDYGIDPNQLIAAGRGEYNTLASNDTAEGRSTNRRTRIIILPKIDQFYDLLNPKLAASQ